MTIDQILHSAADHHRAGRLSNAERLYRAILAEQPCHADALHLLGLIANQTGHHKDACDLINKAIAQRPAAEFYFNLAGAYSPLSDFPHAIAALRNALAMKPNWPDALANLGTTLQVTGQIEEAITVFQKAITLQPRNASFHYNLGNALVAAAKNPHAIEAFQTALRLNPNHSDAMNNLGTALLGIGRLQEAEEKIRHALQLRPDFAQAWNNLGNILMNQGRLPDAEQAFRSSLAINAANPMVYNNLGNALCAQGRPFEAIQAYRQGLAIHPTAAELHNNLSIALRSARDYPAALAAADESLRLLPGYVMARENRALTFEAMEDYDHALDIFAELIAEQPRDERLLNTYGNLLRTTGRVEEAITAYQRGAQANPKSAIAFSNYLFALQFRCEDPAFILAEHRQWDQQFFTPLRAEIKPLDNDRSPARRLRIGYVSPDFREHCQSLFTTPLLSNHDHDQFEIFCYFAFLQTDAVTDRLRTHADHWRSIALLSDSAAADMIRADKIDILIDLTMHMGNCRPFIFALKPAPIQACWLAYPGTTGFSTMDYRLTDPHLDPPDFDDRYTEKSLRLPDSFWCYEPHGMAHDAAELIPEVNDLPAVKNGFITFGCLNDFSKADAGTYQRWGRLMHAVPHSRLHLLAPPGRCPQNALDLLTPFGIAPDRVEFIRRQPRAPYMAEYHRIDLCLDTLPYNGHTTSLDAFWMGVPVLTQIGRTVVGRAGFSQLTNLQLNGFTAHSDEQFQESGLRWSNDLSGLSQIRRTLRDRMTASPLLDAKQFTHAIEDAFRAMWNYWTKA